MSTLRICTFQTGGYMFCFHDVAKLVYQKYSTFLGLVTHIVRASAPFGREIAGKNKNEHLYRKNRSSSNESNQEVD